MTEPEHEVPAHPVFVLRVRADGSESPSAWLDDERVAVPPGSGIHRALIREARRRADRTLPGGTIRVVGLAADGSVSHLAIGPDGTAWEVPPPPDDDIHTVPDDISHTAELQERDGRLIGLVDDEQVPLAPGEDPYEQLLLEARRRADAHAAGRTVRALTRTPDGRVWHVALAPDGTQNVVSPVTRSASPWPSAAPDPGSRPAPIDAFRPIERNADADEPAPQPAYAIESEEDDPTTEGAAAGGLTDDLGRPIPTTTTQVSAHRAHEPSPAPQSWVEHKRRDEPATTRHEPRAGISRRVLVVGGAGVVVLGGAAAAGVFAFRDRSSTPRSTVSTVGTPLPNGLRPPAGLPASYLWSVVNISDVAPRLAVKGNQLICTVNNDTTGGTQLISLDATTGKVQWKSDLPIDAIIADGPRLSPVDGTTSVVLVSQSQIIAYPLSGGEPKTWPLQRDWSTAITSSGVIVTRPDDRTGAYVLHGDRLTRRAIAGDSTPLAALPDGRLVAADAHGRAWLSADEHTAPKAQTLKAPAGAVPGTYVAATATQLITAFVPRKMPAASRLRAFSLPDLDPRITTDPIEPAVFPNTFMLAPDQSWAVGGNTWIDLRTGDSHVITARWSPIAISQYDSWSESGDNILTADRTGTSLGPATGSGGQVLVPRGGTVKVAFCVASVGSDTTLYAVPLTDS